MVLMKIQDWLAVFLVTIMWYDNKMCMCVLVDVQCGS